MGHVVSQPGSGTDPKNIQAMKDWPTPDTVTHVRSFLGFSNYYRRFIPKYAQIAKHLNALILGDNASNRTKKVEWNQDCQETFDKLMELCTTAPVLGFADYSLQFSVHIDASGLGLGAVLYQTQEDGVGKVITFSSRTLE